MKIEFCFIHINSRLPLQINWGATEIAERGWDDGHEDYECRDGKVITVPHRAASIRDMGKTRKAPRNMIMYMASKN